MAREYNRPGGGTQRARNIVAASFRLAYTDAQAFRFTTPQGTAAMTSRINRRRFLQLSAAASGYFFTADALSAARAAAGPNGKVYLAGIGVGGKGSGDISQAGKLAEVIALCDIDDDRLAAKAKEFPSAKKFFDFRQLFDEMGKQFDAVTVSTPDHTHAAASIMAMKLKKHVYCQKPLTHTVYEARQMRLVARQMGVATQMGNQGSASSGLRRAVEVVQAGVIGPVREAHVWTNRPIWPQAPRVTSRPPEAPVPATVHWEQFIGPAPMRPYAAYTDPIAMGRRKIDKPYHPFAWRGWWDFGTGALGDMACHTANMPFRALKLAHPVSIVADATDVNPETYPSSAKISFQFPARENLPPVTLTWYEGQRGGKKLLPPEDLVQKAVSVDTSERRKGRLVDSGSILVGDKGLLYAPSDNGTEFYLYPAKDFEGLNRTRPEKLPVNDKGDLGMKAEWIEAIKGGPPAYSNFDFAGLLTETILLGNIAIRLTGEQLAWDGPELKFTNNARANQYLHYEYRKGWTL
jgi:predicted dehydrogenase